MVKLKKPKKSMYRYRDERIEEYNKRVLNIFSKTKQLKFDELNVLKDTKDLYTQLDDVTQEFFKDLAIHYYESETHGDKEMQVEGWLLDFLSLPNELLKYSYSSELVRKRDRLSESLIATRGNKQEFDTAMRWWARMISWFSLEVVDKALLKAREDDSVEWLVWYTQRDGKVCVDCKSLDGKVFKIENSPTKPHPNCRCEIRRS